MEFIRKSLWALFAFLALGCQSGQAMEKDCFTGYVPNIKKLILKDVFLSQKTEETNFRDIGINLSLVCKDWKKNIGKNAKIWVCEHFNIEEKHRKDFWDYFTKGKLVYTNVKTDNVQVFYFSAAPNPFKHTFDLSKCDDAGEVLSFHLGIPTEDKEVAAKVQTWFFFSPDVENKLESTTQHLKPIFPVEVPVCILWTWGYCNDQRAYDSLATESMDNLSKFNLYENWKKSQCSSIVGRWVGWMKVMHASRYSFFQVLFVN